MYLTVLYGAIADIELGATHVSYARDVDWNITCCAVLKGGKYCVTQLHSQPLVTTQVLEENKLVTNTFLLLFRRLQKK